MFSRVHLAVQIERLTKMSTGQVALAGGAVDFTDGVMKVGAHFRCVRQVSVHSLYDTMQRLAYREIRSAPVARAQARPVRVGIVEKALHEAAGLLGPILLQPRSYGLKLGGRAGLRSDPGLRSGGTRLRQGCDN